MTTPTQFPKPADDVAAMVEEYKKIAAAFASQSVVDAEIAADIVNETTALITRQAEQIEALRAESDVSDALLADAKARAEAAEKRNVELEARLAKAVKVLDAILRAHNEGSGLIDCIDNAGERYTSRFLAETIETARAVLATLKEKHDADR